MDVYDYDEGNGISATLCEHNAKWHKTCRLTFYPRELERIIARKSRQASGAVIIVKNMQLKQI